MSSNPIIVVRSQPATAVIRGPGLQGPPGPPGASGDATTIARTAAIALSGHRAVATNADGDFVYADKDTAAHASCTIGITTGAASQGASASAIALGPLTENSWNWTPQQLIFLGSNGVLTQSAPTTGFVLVLGKAVSPTTVFVQIQSAFIRS